jgi:phosphatidylglycerophosphate synthase
LNEHAWVLVLSLPTGDPGRVLGGLPLCLRLALDAQAAGASGVVVTDPRAIRALADARLRLPLLNEPPAGVRTVRVPASWLVHRQTFKRLPSSSDHDLSREQTAPDAAYAFAPIDVHDAASAARAERLLFRSLRKPQDGWTSRWLNRYISLTLSRWLARTPLQPNQLSLAILGVGLAGAWLASRGDYASLLGGACLFQAQSVLDGCDGELSRVTHRGSHLGEWLDTIGDDLTNYAFFGAAAWGLYRTSGSELYLAAGAVTLFAGVLASGIEYRYLIRIGSGDLLRYPLSSEASAKPGVLAAIQPLFKRDTFVLLTLIAAALGAVGPMLVLFAGGALGVLLSVLAAERRMAQDARKPA